MVHDLLESPEQTLARAQEKEGEYDWIGAVELYKTALNSESDRSQNAELHERRGYGYYRGALQAEKVADFRERISQAISDYEKARELYEAQKGSSSTRLRCEAMANYLRSWTASSAPDKQQLLQKSWTLAKESLKTFEEEGDGLGYGTTHNQLWATAYYRSWFEWNFQTLEETLKEALAQGERAITHLSAPGNSVDLARAYVITSGWLDWVGNTTLSDPDEQERYELKALDYWAKAKELSEEAAMLQAPLSATAFGVGSDEALNAFESSLEWGRKARDRLVVGAALEQLSNHTYWKARGTADPDESTRLFRQASQYAEDAKSHYTPIAFTSAQYAVLGAEAPRAEPYLQLVLFETDAGKRRELLESSRRAALDDLRRAEESGYPTNITHAHHTLSKSLALLANAEKEPQAKKNLLEEALNHRNESIKIGELLDPHAYWNLGIGQNYLADIQSELANLAKEPAEKENLLRDAISTKGTCLKLFKRVLPTFEKIGSFGTFASAGQRTFEFGDLYNSLHRLTDDDDDLKKAAEAFEEAAELLHKPKLASRIAECHWKTAEAYSSLGIQSKAGENFRKASDSYKIASEKIPQLRDFYHEYASYMEAWSEIEKARYHHERGEYKSAGESYQKAAELHETTKEWGFLAPNYSAWSHVESGENLSRKEQSGEAIDAFKEAARLFSETRVTIQARLQKIENPDQKQMIAALLKGADFRREYCGGRVALEEARLLDRNGDYSASWRKYGEAADTFDKITLLLESKRARMELELVAKLSRAWQTMTRAEQESSPELYLEASRLFEESKEVSIGERGKSLALGHSRFCRALEAGTKFSDSGNVSFYEQALQQLQSASKYYLKAGLTEASEYAEATQRLFDAYRFMGEAGKERDPEKKAKLYMMTEKVLQATAESFLKASYPAKRDEVLLLLEKVKKEREFAVSLIEVLGAPSFVSTTAAFTAPTSPRESAVGLEKFEHADIQANLIISQRTLHVGEHLNLEIELVNAGRSPAQMVKIEEIIPEGFEITAKPEYYRVEGRHLSLKGRQLGPLKTEEVKLVLTPRVRGQFSLRPRVVYLDDAGRHKSHQPEPIDVTVKELGFSGWLKGG